MSIRKRLPPEESRRAAMEAARALLIESGPPSVTLKAVAARIGRTHANLLHHFGSAAGLQQELARPFQGSKRIRRFEQPLTRSGVEAEVRYACKLAGSGSCCRR